MSIYKLGDICNIFKGKTSIIRSKPGPYPLITTAENHQSNINYDFDSEAVCIPLVSSSGHGHASINRLHYIEGKFALGSILAALIPNGKIEINTKYIYIYLYLRKEDILIPLMKGSANVSLTIAALKSISIEVPIISIQRKIIKEFEKLENYHNKLRYEFKQFLAYQNDFINSCLRNAFKGLLIKPNLTEPIAKILNANSKKESFILKKNEALYKIPKNWYWIKLKNVGDNSGQKIPQGDFTYIDVASIDKNKGEVVKNPQVLRFSNAPSRARKVAKFGSVIYSTVRPNLNNIAIIKNNYSPELIVSTAFAVINTYAGIESKYLYYYLRSPIFRSYVENKMSGVSYPSISELNFYNGLVPVAPVSEQKRIVKKIEQLLKYGDLLKSELFNSIERCEFLLKGILLDHLSRNLGGKFSDISLPFAFSDLEKEKKYKVKFKISTMGKGDLKDIDLDILVKEFKNSAFTFKQISEKSSLGYEELKYIIFNLLDLKVKSKPTLELFFDKTSEEMIFKISKS